MSPIALALVASCGHPSSTVDAPPGDSQPGEGGQAGPDILSFGTDVTTLTEGQSVRFVALVTDPAGLGHLVGGRLTDSAGQINYGAFVADQQGSYSLDVSWNQIDQVAPIMFVAGDTRTMVGRFVDDAGREASRSVTLALTCNGLSACAGRCVDVTTDPMNCGGCGQAVTPSVETCEGGMPVVVWSACVNPVINGVDTCTAYCAVGGFHCGDACGTGHMNSSELYAGDACQQGLSGTEQAMSCDATLFNNFYRCCCTP